MLLAACTQLNEVTLNWPTAWCIIAVITAVALVGGILAWRR